MAILRAAPGVLGGSEARPLDEVQDRRRGVTELLAGAARRLEVLEAQGGVPLELLSRVPLHEREVERPPGQAEHRHPDQLLLEEEAKERQPPQENPLQDRNVALGQVIRDDEVRDVPPEPFETPDVVHRRLRDAEAEGVDGDPRLADGDEKPRDAALPGGERDGELEERDEVEERSRGRRYWWRTGGR